ncbi:hypothetical protein CCACVL1_30949, partial [Corchorus capsularis]
VSDRESFIGTKEIGGQRRSILPFAKV